MMTSHHRLKSLCGSDCSYRLQYLKINSWRSNGRHSYDNQKLVRNKKGFNR